MITNAVATRYVQALYELAGERDQHQLIGQQIRNVLELLEKSSELDTLFSNPAIDPQKKLNVFEEIAPLMQLDEITTNYVSLLIRKRRVGFLASMCQEYDRLERERLGVMAVELTTAHALNKKTQKEIQEQLEKVLGKKVEMITNEDAEIIGGMIAQIGGTVYDGSIGHQLALLQQRLGEE
jgi:F-type H+-transporting ATPase subunit delta